MLRGSYTARDRQKGFTLVEVLIVIVVLGVLAAIVILALGAFDDRGELAACKADVASVEVAVDAYKADQGNYPANLGELTKAPGNYLREVPNTEEGSGDYWIVYDPASGTVEGRLKSNEVCAGELAMATPGPSGTATEPGGPGGGGEPGGGTSTTTSPGTTTPSPGGGNSTTTTTTPNPSPTPGKPATPVANCFNPPGRIDDIDCVLSWSPPSGLRTGYEWQLAGRDGSTCSAEDDFEPWDFPLLDRTSSTSVTFQILWPANYCFRVRAVNGNIEGPWSDPVGFTWLPDWT